MIGPTWARGHISTALFALLVLSHGNATAASLPSPLPTPLATPLPTPLPTPAATITATSIAVPTDRIAAADTLELTGLQQKFEAIAHRVSPSVVSISAIICNAADSDIAHREIDFTPQKLQETLEKTARTVGTGFVIDQGGYILTNEHVIGDAQQLWITTDDKRVMPAIVVGSDPRADLAVLRVPDQNLPPITLADPTQTQRGDWSIAMGNPFGLATEGEMCMSVGVVAATERSLPRLSSREGRIYSNLIQTTAQINPGNSGGPLFDLRGDVLGINTAVILPQHQTNGIGFAIPLTADVLKEVAELEQGQEVVYGYLGMIVNDATPHERAACGLSDLAGVCVSSIEPGSPAASAGVEEGDLILTLGNATISNTDQFVKLVGQAAVGHPELVRLYRQNKPLTLAVIPARRPAVANAITRDNQRLRWRGMLLGPAPLDPAAGEARQAAGVIVLNVDADSPMRQQGIEPGVRITTLAGQRVDSLTSLMQLLNDLPPDRCVLGVESEPAAVASVASTGGDRKPD